MKKNKELKTLAKFRARQELKTKILKIITDFSSKEEPNINITNKDIVYVLSSIITKKTE